MASQAILDQFKEIYNNTLAHKNTVLEKLGGGTVLVTVPLFSNVEDFVKAMTDANDDFVKGVISAIK